MGENGEKRLTLSQERSFSCRNIWELVLFVICIVEACSNLSVSFSKAFQS